MRKEINNTREFYGFWYSLLRGGGTSKSFIKLWKNGEGTARTHETSHQDYNHEVPG